LIPSCVENYPKEYLEIYAIIMPISSNCACTGYGAHGQCRWAGLIDVGLVSLISDRLVRITAHEIEDRELEPEAARA
jgi:hypothetical protein